MKNNFADTALYVASNITLLDERRLNEALVQVNIKLIQKELNIFVNEEGKIGNTRLHVDLFKINSEKLIQDVRDRISSMFKSMEDYFLFTENYGLFYTHWFYYSEGNRFHINNEYSTSLNDLVYFFRHIINGRHDKDYGETFKVLNKYKSEFDDEKSFGMKPDFDFTIAELGIRLKKYKSGRLDIFCIDELLQKIINTSKLIQEYKKLQ